MLTDSGNKLARNLTLYLDERQYGRVSVKSVKEGKRGSARDDCQPGH